MPGAVTLGDIAGRLAMLEVCCDRCGRRGRLRVICLVAEHGAGMGLPQLRRIVAADCPRWGGSEYDPCGVHDPQLLALAGGRRGRG